jgi:lipopolysaccharide/colanic/teichoic acid biosynthesis glycosyltransferase
MIILGSLLALPALFGWRLLYIRKLCPGMGRERILILGATPEALEIARQIEAQPEFGFSVIGFVDARPEISSDTLKVLCGLPELTSIVEAARPDCLLVGLAALEPSTLAELQSIRLSGVALQPASAFYEMVFGRVPTAMPSLPGLVFQPEPMFSRASILAVQSIYTNLLVLTVVLGAVPVIILAAIAIKLSSRGAALVGQTCTGLQGIPFQRWRFQCRRRKHNPDGSIQQPLSWVGRLLIRYRLEGLPQCLNVMRGEMSFVGPEPERVEFSDVLSARIPAYSQRYTVKPGIIGWAQLNCDTESLPNTVARLEYDLYYAKHISPVLDVIIFLRALGVMFQRRPVES